MPSSVRAISVVPVTWEQRLHLIRNVALGLSLLSTLVAVASTQLEPWTWTSAGQRGVELWFQGLGYLVSFTIVIAAADLLVRAVRRR